MATEPYVPIAQLTAQQALMTELEVTTDDAEPYADDLDTAVDSTLSSKTIADALAAQQFNLFLLGGA